MPKARKVVFQFDERSMDSLDRVKAQGRVVPAVGSMLKPVWYCTTNSGHEHSTSWEAENCSELHQALCELADGYQYAQRITHTDAREILRSAEIR
jgi:hypothetical protein